MMGDDVVQTLHSLPSSAPVVPRRTLVRSLSIRYVHHLRQIRAVISGASAVKSSRRFATEDGSGGAVKPVYVVTVVGVARATVTAVRRSPRRVLEAVHVVRSDAAPRTAAARDADQQTHAAAVIALQSRSVAFLKLLLSVKGDNAPLSAIDDVSREWYMVCRNGAVVESVWERGCSGADG